MSMQHIALAEEPNVNTAHSVDCSAEHCCSTKANAMAQRQIPWHKGKCHGTNRKCHGTKSKNCSTNEQMPEHKEQQKTVMAMAMPTTSHTAAQVDHLKKLNWIFFIFNCCQFSPFLESLWSVTTSETFSRSRCHHCPWWLHLVDCFVKVFFCLG